MLANVLADLYLRNRAARIGWPPDQTILPASSGSLVGLGLLGGDDQPVGERLQRIELVTSVDAPILESGELQHQDKLASADPALREAGACAPDRAVVAL